MPLSPESSQTGQCDQTHEDTAQGEIWVTRVKELREEGEMICFHQEPQWEKRVLMGSRNVPFAFQGNLTFFLQLRNNNNKKMRVFGQGPTLASGNCDNHWPCTFLSVPARGGPCWWEGLSLHSIPEPPASPASSPTFGLQAVGVKVHSLLTLGAAHQEPGHGLSREEGIGLRNLRTEKVCSLYGTGGGRLVTRSPRSVCWWQMLGP